MALRIVGRDTQPIPLSSDKCPHRKQGWFSERDANIALEYISSRRRADEKSERRVYRCEECPSWHLTSREEWHANLE